MSTNTNVTSSSAGMQSGSRVLDRNALFGALDEAVRSDSPQSVLVVFGFEGLKEYLDEASEANGDELLEILGERLTEAVGQAGSVYASRRGEFCALLEGGMPVVRSLLTMVPSELDDAVRRFGVRSLLGITVLPAEATDSIYALALADRRLRALSGDLRAKVR